MEVQLSPVPCCPHLSGRNPGSASWMMTLAFLRLLAEQFLKQLPTWGFWFHKNAVFLGNKLVFLHFLWKPGRQRGFPCTSCKPAGTTVGEGLPAHLTGPDGSHGCPAALLPTWQTAPIAWLPGQLSTWVAKSLHKSSWNVLYAVSKQSSFLKSS